MTLNENNNKQTKNNFNADHPFPKSSLATVLSKENIPKDQKRKPTSPSFPSHWTLLGNYNLP